MAINSASGIKLSSERCFLFGGSSSTGIEIGSGGPNGCSCAIPTPGFNFPCDPAAADGVK